MLYQCPGPICVHSGVEGSRRLVLIHLSDLSVTVSTMLRLRAFTFVAPYSSHRAWPTGVYRTPLRKWIGEPRRAAFAEQQKASTSILAMLVRQKERKFFMPKTVIQNYWQKTNFGCLHKTQQGSLHAAQLNELRLFTAVGHPQLQHVSTATKMGPGQSEN
jgi:hypothetical protein